MKTTVGLSHPVAFVFDFSNKDAVIPETGNTLVSANETCVAIAAIADVDGDVTFELCAHKLDDRPGMKEVFHGTLSTPGRKLAIVTSHNERLLEVAVTEKTCRISIAVDDETHPTNIVVEIL